MKGHETVFNLHEYVSKEPSKSTLSTIPPSTVMHFTAQL